MDFHLGLEHREEKAPDVGFADTLVAIVGERTDYRIEKEVLTSFRTLQKDSAWPLMPNPPRHPNKEIRAAVEYAAEKGWRIEKAGPRAHVWGQMYCPHAQRGGCIVRVYSTPRNPEGHALNLRADIDRCPHAKPEREP